MNIGLIIMFLTVAISLALTIVGGVSAMRERKFLAFGVMGTIALVVTIVGFNLSLNLRNYEFNMENMRVEQIVKEEM